MNKQDSVSYKDMYELIDTKFTLLDTRLDKLSDKIDERITPLERAITQLKIYGTIGIAMISIFIDLGTAWIKHVLKIA